MKSIFPKEMMSNSSEMTLESIAENFSFFVEQIHLLHLQTNSYSEHMALGIWDDIMDMKDSFLEKLMGYEGRKVKSYKIPTFIDYSPGAPMKVINDLKNFSKQLEDYASLKGYRDIENLSQELNGLAAKTLYLLTLS